MDAHTQISKTISNCIEGGGVRSLLYILLEYMDYMLSRFLKKDMG